MTQNPFTGLGISDEVLRAVKEMGFDNATEIQSKSIPQILEGHDIIGRSQTGTGKTAAFAIPAVEMTDGTNKRDIQVLVVCPTRELAIQSWGVMKRLYKYKSGVKAAAIFGGQQIERQIHELHRGVNIIIGTPGRIMDHMRRKTLRLDNLKLLVLDEADEMLDMGFREDIETILSSTPKSRQTVFFSATMPPEILSITNRFLKDPVTIEVNRTQMTLDAINHYYCEVPAEKKSEALYELILKKEIKKSIIFCNTQKMVDKLNKFMIANHCRSVAIHGGMRQNVRTVVMTNFKDCKEGFLVATDVAARGIDARGVDAVINYDIPANTEYYIHRIGRTARAGNKGDAYTLVSNRAQALMLRDIEHAVNVKMEFCDLYNKGEGTFLKNIPQNLHGKRAAFADRRENKRPSRRNGDFKRIEINIGKKNFVAPNNIVRAIAENTSLSGSDIGKINIFDKNSIVEVPATHINEVLDAMKDSKINRVPVTVVPYNGADIPARREYKGPRNNDVEGKGKPADGDKRRHFENRGYKKPYRSDNSHSSTQKRRTF